MSKSKDSTGSMMLDTLAGDIIKEMNFDTKKMAKTLQPIIEKEIKERMRDTITDGDFIYDAIDNNIDWDSITRELMNPKILKPAKKKKK